MTGPEVTLRYYDGTMLITPDEKRNGTKVADPFTISTSSFQQGSTHLCHMK
jgi:hypothetical protein